ncbi:rCG63461 [Rattus norvegicus]|uniref:RCG63461 n=1 Tax=Rattus norvegicus TaxID=10116 RepID=A6HB67_RAT|nr:rCG63461 [Rattus norvegicus]
MWKESFWISARKRRKIIFLLQKQYKQTNKNSKQKPHSSIPYNSPKAHVGSRV